MTQQKVAPRASRPPQSGQVGAQSPLAPPRAGSQTSLLARYGRRQICTMCGTVGDPVVHTPGVFWLELALWVALLLPGVLYSAWRITARGLACPKCQHIGVMIPVQSPVGRELVGRYHGVEQSGVAP